MIKEALQYLVSLKANKTYEINGQNYSDNQLNLIAPVVYRPEAFTVTGLDSIVQLVRNEISNFSKQLPVYIRVSSECRVDAYTSYDDYMARTHLYSAVFNAPGFTEGFRELENAIIEIRSKFLPTDDTKYLLDTISRMSKEESVSTDDNGVSQTVQARAGIQLKQEINLKPRVSLKPFRTFLEVAQPESEFLFRVDKDFRIGLFEADGGVWKLEAKSNIAEYFHRELQDLVEAGSVVVMM